MVTILFNWIIKPIIGVLVGQTAIQLAHLFGFYPDRLLAEGVYGLVTQTPSPEIVELFQWGLAAVIGLSLLGAYEFAKSRRKSPSVDTDPYVSLKEAATIAYEETRGTKVAAIIEGPNKDNILGYYARALFKGTTLYGNRPPSRKLEAIPNEEYGRCGISDDQNGLWRRADSRILYENLKIKRSDLDRRIAELKSAATEPQNETHDFALANLDEWRDVDPLEIWRAGCLWKGYKPHYPIPFVDPVYPSFIRLVNAAKAGQLIVTKPNSTIDAQSFVTRRELARFAHNRGEMPEFLKGVALENHIISEMNYLPLNDAVMDAWERIRTLPEFDRQPSHSPEFASLRDYYEREPAKLPGIVAQIIFNSADPPLPIEGVAPPRTAMEVIPQDTAKGYAFSDDATEMFDIFDREKPAEQRRRYTNLRVKRANIERRVKAIEEDNGKR